jgi:nucleoside-diphosphate-sugar epimerase
LSSGIPASILRLTGIYGPGREWLLTQVRRGYRVAVDPPLYANRIHADDAAGLMACLLEADQRVWRWMMSTSASMTRRRVGGCGGLVA